MPVALVIDASSSMSKRAHAVRVATAQARETFAAMDDGRQYFLCIIEFADQGRLAMPMTHVATMPEYQYQPRGNTKLYSTAYEALAMFMSALDQVKQPQADQQISLAVFSDGDDNQSPAADQLALQALARRALSSGVNFQLQSYGIGIDANKLAANMGFPLDMAMTVEGSPRGVTEAISTMTEATTMTPNYAREIERMRGEVSNPPPVPPPPPSNDEVDQAMQGYFFQQPPIRPPSGGVDHTLGTSHFPKKDDSSTFDPMNTLI